MYHIYDSCTLATSFFLHFLVVFQAVILTRVMTSDEKGYIFFTCGVPTLYDRYVHLMFCVDDNYKIFLLLLLFFIPPFVFHWYMRVYLSR